MHTHTHIYIYIYIINTHTHTQPNIHTHTHTHIMCKIDFVCCFNSAALSKDRTCLSNQVPYMHDYKTAFP